MWWGWVMVVSAETSGSQTWSNPVKLGQLPSGFDCFAALPSTVLQNVLPPWLVWHSGLEVHAIFWFDMVIMAGIAGMWISCGGWLASLL
jgi:hypothetical protein